MEKTAAIQAYVNFMQKRAAEEEEELGYDPNSAGRILRSGILGGLSPIAGGISSAVAAPRGRKGRAFGASLGLGAAGALPGALLSQLGTSEGLRNAGTLAAMLGGGSGSALGHHLMNRPRKKEEDR